MLFRIQPPRESSSKGENYQSSLSARSKETLSQVFISVKTTSRYHYPRLVILLETWASLVPDTTWFFTDTAGDPELVRRSHNLSTDQKKGNNTKFCAASAIFLFSPRRHAGGPQ